MPIYTSTWGPGRFFDKKGRKSRDTVAFISACRILYSKFVEEAWVIVERNVRAAWRLPEKNVRAVWRILENLLKQLGV